MDGGLPRATKRKILRLHGGRAGGVRGGLNWHHVRLSNGQIKLLLTYDDDPRIVEFEDPAEPIGGDPAHQASPVCGPGRPVDSFGKLPASVRQFATERWLRAQDDGLPPLTAEAVDAYFSTVHDTRVFNQHLPLPSHLLHKWKDGVRLWPKVKSSFMPAREKRSEALDTIIRRLLAAGLITHGKRGPFCSNIFLVPKGEGKVRPVIDYSHLTKVLPTPRMVLPNIFQLVHGKRWLPNLFYLKIDFTNAFFNIPLHPKSKHVTTFRYGGHFYKWEVLPFGISLAPYAMQKHLQALINEIRKSTPYVWGHIDDIIIAMESRAGLQQLSLHIQSICEKIGWRINLKKSVLTPAESVKFLGSTWGSTHVTRSTEATRTVALVLQGTERRKLTGRTLQRVRGYLNYYLSFAGNYHALVNRVLKRTNKAPFTQFLINIARTDNIAFRPPDPTNYEVIYTDASTYGIALK